MKIQINFNSGLNNLISLDVIVSEEEFFGMLNIIINEKENWGTIKRAHKRERR